MQEEEHLSVMATLCAPLCLPREMEGRFAYLVFKFQAVLLTIPSILGRLVRNDKSASIFVYATVTLFFCSNLN